MEWRNIILAAVFQLIFATRWLPYLKKLKALQTVYSNIGVCLAVYKFNNASHINRKQPWMAWIINSKRNYTSIFSKRNYASIFIKRNDTCLFKEELCKYIFIENLCKYLYKEKLCTYLFIEKLCKYLCKEELCKHLFFASI